ncbi:hypothetical protein DFJ63DRAFT_311839 [Scheffersomyces coipomensis]|uniref:uncharacterized protein n=1 Tax=Scheffersomyces coipomensis TaxID=1788519 RepID=UPI00315CDCE6
MQGSYKNNGLPRPYYMKPSKKRIGGGVGSNSPYDNFKQPIVFFTSSPRKLLGYVVMLILFGTCIYWISQDIKTQPEPSYEIVKTSKDINNPNSPPVLNDNTYSEDDEDTIEIVNPNQNNKNIQQNSHNNNNNNRKVTEKNNIAVNKNNGVKIDSTNIDLAGNLAQGSKGQKGVGVVEAPKGGIANEAAVVGTDEEEIIGGKNSRNKQAGANAAAAGAGSNQKVVYNGAGGPPDGKPIALAGTGPGLTRGYKASKELDNNNNDAPIKADPNVNLRAKQIIEETE